MEKAFLIDVVSKIYIATDSSFVDMQMYELASDMIDVVVDISCIYGCVNLIVESLGLLLTLNSVFLMNQKGKHMIPVLIQLLN